MNAKVSLLPFLPASIAILALTAAQAVPSQAQASPSAAKTSAAKQGTMQDNSFALSHGTNTLRAMLVSAPPVYDPGGPVCFIEDWSDDTALLGEAEQTAAAKGAVLTRVICPHSETDRATALTQHGYSVASEWYTAPLPLTGMPTPHGIRLLTDADVPRVLELGEQKRREYQAYSPVFWRMSSLPRETFGPYMKSQIENPQNIALAHEQDGEVDGFVLVNAWGTIDDYAVAAPSLWPTIGASLLQAAGDTAHKKGVKSLLVVCGAGDIPKRTMLAAQGLTLATDWYVKPISLKKK